MRQVTWLQKQPISTRFQTSLGTKTEPLRDFLWNWKEATSSNLSAQPASLQPQYICRTKTSTVLYSSICLTYTSMNTRAHRQRGSGGSVFMFFTALSPESQIVCHIYSEFLFLYFFLFVFDGPHVQNKVSRNCVRPHLMVFHWHFFMYWSLKVDFLPL